MSSPSNPNPTPGRSTGNTPNRQGVSPTDPTYTQWPPVVSPGTQAPGSTPHVSPNDPTLTQWAQTTSLPPADPLTPPAPPPEPPATRKAARRGPRSLFWPGFAVGFLLLAAISCGVLTAALGLNRLTLDDIRGGTGAAWTPMPMTPTSALVEAAPEAAGGAQPVPGSTRFAAGQAARNMTNSRVNIRMTPGYLGKTASDVIGQLEAGQTLAILGEQTVADELTWWQIQADDNGQTVVGWVAESTASGVQILGSTP